ncbi:aminomethyl-transferring glycine dehydrogenase [Gaopeijia maritima]|uniref:aminomethyl-transferring glycine dehydrogenase n=1 Tax=Gaopeijia maritima TaxID=3119007 RepID=UPI003249E0B6
MALNIDTRSGFAERHIGPSDDDIREMLDSLGLDSLDTLVRETVPASIAREELLDLPEALDESALLERLREIAAKNRVMRSYIGMGYHGTLVPGVIQRNILENPGWYTQYTPYQAEIAQGRLEALLNFQTVLIDLTGLEIANASLLDEGTAAAEAMSMFAGETKEDRDLFFVSDACHPQTIAVVQTRAEPLGIRVEVGDWQSFTPGDDCIGALLCYPATDGGVHDYAALVERVHAVGGFVAVVADLLALTLLTPPGEWGADVVVGNSQRFGVPMGYGGPHAGFMSARDRFKRRMPGRIIGVSVDTHGNRALRMALQTREQHIRREKATSNICTAQVLLAVMAGMYAVYHGPEGLRAIAERVRNQTAVLGAGLRRLGHTLAHGGVFDTLRVTPQGRTASEVLDQARELGINLRDFGDGSVGVALDQTVSAADVDDLFRAFNGGHAPDFSASDLAAEVEPESFPEGLERTSSYLEHPVFHRYRSETEMLRYMHRLESRDLSLNTSMIPLGSCTMKLNATTQMAGVTWPEFGSLHPFVPADQAQGYAELFGELERWLGEIAGLPAVSLQPNSGAQGEYAGLQVIRAYHLDRGEDHRNVCLIPSSAHGTNPASAVMSGMKVVVVKVDDSGSIDLDDLVAKADAHADHLAAIMVTYPSTHGVFEEEIRQVCDIVHERGGMVYLDGANLNAQVGLARPGDYGADVCHINLHKTFAIPHGGGGPGMGPICANEKLAPFLPGHPVVRTGGDRAIGPISAAPWGSASILVISWAYIALLGPRGLRRSSEVAILNANYMAGRLEDRFEVLFRGRRGRVAHEFILDLRPFRRTAQVTEEDVAKRLQDYGFHGPTMSWPVVGTIMVEPTESESRSELDRFCDALLAIRDEIEEIAEGAMDASDNALKNAPHTAAVVTADEWSHPYSRARAAFPAAWTRDYKFWPTTGRVDNAYGDRNLVCACPPIEEYADPPVAAD